MLEKVGFAYRFVVEKRQPFDGKEVFHHESIHDQNFDELGPLHKKGLDHNAVKVVSHLERVWIKGKWLKQFLISRFLITVTVDENLLFGKIDSIPDHGQVELMMETHIVALEQSWQDFLVQLSLSPDVKDGQDVAVPF